MPRSTILARLTCGALLSFAASGPAFPQAAKEDVNAANNPLQPTLGVNLQDQYVGSYYGLEDKDSNVGMLRGTLPHKLFGAPQILRVTAPVITTLDLPPQGRTTGGGDLNLFDLFLFKAGGVEIGIGPQLTIPTASDDQTGSGKWQGGLAAAIVAPQHWGLAGGLVTWQASFAGDADRRSQNTMQVQPVVIYNLPSAWYLRSSATANFDLQANSNYIPIGLGIGKVFKAAGTTYNLFVEPQWTVAHHGTPAPRFQVFMGLNLQFPL